MSDNYTSALPRDTILAGRYSIESVLGQGGFGMTYTARDLQTGNKIAVKEFFPQGTAIRDSDEVTMTLVAQNREEGFIQGLESFINEARLLAKMSSCPNIVKVYGCFKENDTAYFTMEYLEGESFKDMLKRSGGKLPWQQVAEILKPIINALGTIHASGIIHRDVTPDNIYITKDGIVKLLDFGSARFSVGDHTQTLDIVLKHGYAPKEQYLRRGRQGPFTDIYSLAACFYAAITGFVPPDSPERVEEDTLMRPSALGIQLPPQFENAILKGLAVQPQDRFQSAAAFENALFGTGAPVMGSMNTGGTNMGPVTGGMNTGGMTMGPVTGGMNTGGMTMGPVTGGMNTGGMNMGPVTGGINTGGMNMGGMPYQPPKKKGSGGVIAAVVGITAAVIAAVVIVNNTNKSNEKTVSAENPETVEAETTDKTPGQYEIETEPANTEVYSNTGGGSDYSSGSNNTYSFGKEQLLAEIASQTWTEGDTTYSGINFNGYLQGYGRAEYSNGIVDEGYFVDGMMVYGTETYSDGDKYVGGFDPDGHRSGYGTYYWSSGAEYRGEWADGNFNGYGEYVYAPDNETYDFCCGYYVDDHKEGEAVTVRRDNGVAEKDLWSGGDVTQEIGSYDQTDPAVAALLEIHYTQTWTDEAGDTYTGHRANGLITGDGKVVYADGTVYEGEFVSGEPRGWGTAYDVSATIEGYFPSFGNKGWLSTITDSFTISGSTLKGDNGFVSDGYNKKTFKPGNESNIKESYGIYSNDSAEGEMIVIFFDDTVSSMPFTNGQLNGTAIIYNSDGTVTKEVYQNGNYISAG